MTRAVLEVPNISCENCECRVKSTMEPIGGVGVVPIDVPAQEVTVDYEVMVTMGEMVRGPGREGLTGRLIEDRIASGRPASAWELPRDDLPCSPPELQPPPNACTMDCVPPLRHGHIHEHQQWSPVTRIVTVWPAP